MAFEQLEFDFMREFPIRIQRLGYIGGQDEHLGGYCEPLVVQFNSGSEDYVLHAMNQSGGFGANIVNNHQMLRFRSRAGLLKEWDNVLTRLGLNRSLDWKVTNSTCGYSITPEQFYETLSQDVKVA